MKRAIILLALLAGCDTNTVGLETAQDAADGGAAVIQQGLTTTARAVYSTMSVTYDGWLDSRLQAGDSVYGGLSSFTMGWDVQVFGATCQYFTLPGPVPHNCIYNRFEAAQIVRGAFVGITNGPCTLLGAPSRGFVSSQFFATSLFGQFTSDTGQLLVYWVPRDSSGSDVWLAARSGYADMANVDAQGRVQAGFGLGSVHQGWCGWWESYAGQQLPSCHDATCLIESDCGNGLGDVQLNQSCWGSGAACVFAPFNSLAYRCNSPGISPCCPGD